MESNRFVLVVYTMQDMSLLKVCTVFILLQSAGSISRKALFAAGIIGNLLNTAAGSIRGAGLNRMRIVLE